MKIKERKGGGMLTDLDLMSLSAGQMLYNKQHCYVYSGCKDGTHFYFYKVDEKTGEPEAEPTVVLRKSEVKKLHRL